MKKKVLSLVLVILLIFSSSIAFAASDTQAGITELTIIHTNDTHARITEDNGSIGFAKIAAMIKAMKEKNPNTLVVDAGDTLYGMPVINVSKGENAVKILNKIGYDFMTPGNHDFNYGYERLLELEKMADFKMINANILDAEKNNIFTPYSIVEINGIKVGIFGLTTPETAYKTSPSNVKDLVFDDAINISQKIVNELQDKTDIIIALAHIGLDKSSVVTSEAIAKNVNGIDVIIDGHSHTALESGMLVNNTLIAQTGEYDNKLGCVSIQIQDGKIISKAASLLAAPEGIEADKDVSELLNAIEEENKLSFSKVIAHTDIVLDGARENVRTKETNLGNLSADAVRNAAGSDIAFVNGGNIRDTIPVGDITLGFTKQVFPFGNIIQVIELSGEDIIRALENSVSGYPATQGGFLQVSGLSFKFSQDREIGSRIYETKIGGELIDTAQELAKKYTVAINDFLIEGGDGYDVFKDKKVVGEYGSYEDIFANYLNTNGTKGCEVSGRIIEAPATNNNTSNNEVIYIVVPGDCLWRIALKYNITWQEIAKYNKLANPNLIFPNQKLLIPIK